MLWDSFVLIITSIKNLKNNKTLMSDLGMEEQEIFWHEPIAGILDISAN